MLARPTKQTISLMVILLLLLTFASCAKKSTPIAEIDLNGGFEEKAPYKEEPNGWYATRLPETVNDVAFAWEDGVAHGGQRSVSIAIKESHPEDTIAYNWTRTVEGYEVGGTYEISGWVKTEDLSGPAFVVVQCWDKERKEMLGFATTQQDYPLTGTTDWTLVKTTFTVPEGTEEVRLRAGIAAPENIGGKVWFDDIHISRKTN